MNRMGLGYHAAHKSYHATLIKYHNLTLTHGRKHPSIFQAIYPSGLQGVQSLSQKLRAQPWMRVEPIHTDIIPIGISISLDYGGKTRVPREHPNMAWG